MKNDLVTGSSGLKKTPICEGNRVKDSLRGMIRTWGGDHLVIGLTWVITISNR